MVTVLIVFWGLLDCKNHRVVSKSMPSHSSLFQAAVKAEGYFCGSVCVISLSAVFPGVYTNAVVWW